ncbi:hypothetical protein [Chachezhania sediminis]|uniref:hypothetical protein n=1 Tax=Chachezhania sediminis TaxID=2599291 RepID=UPI00131B289E|nr:hypothetical protein [Chachezhania sediminis]
MTTTLGRPAWIAALSAVSILISLALTCGMPFAALGAVAALALPLRDGVAAVLLAWLANQAIGFGLLGYPTDPETIAWGVALSLSALAALCAARFTKSALNGSAPALRWILGFATAFCAQQAVIWTVGLALSSHPGAISLPVLAYVGWTNALAFTLLAAVQWAGVAAGVAPAPLRQLRG